jgi:hypothetical protein
MMLHAYYHKWIHMSQHKSHSRKWREAPFLEWYLPIWEYHVLCTNAHQHSPLFSAQLSVHEQCCISVVWVITLRVITLDLLRYYLRYLRRVTRRVEELSTILLCSSWRLEWKKGWNFMKYLLGTHPDYSFCLWTKVEMGWSNPFPPQFMVGRCIGGGAKIFRYWLSRYLHPTPKNVGQKLSLGKVV